MIQQAGKGVRNLFRLFGRRDAVTPGGQFNETRLPRQEKGS
jgi:hypothetical protein